MGSDWYGYPDTDKCDEESVGVSRIVTCEVQQPKEDVLLCSQDTYGGNPQSNSSELNVGVQVNCLFEKKTGSSPSLMKIENS